MNREGDKRKPIDRDEFIDCYQGGEERGKKKEERLHRAIIAPVRVSKVAFSFLVVKSPSHPPS
jgi:hypothetical protein